ncbi:Pentatricopeptide repeat-containing protein [Platanthera guangdongensis]|uniref:Pentatricopeptide repeat-containing protein n=1 Tax=Platanthera guangdongensis TaxID=2320717 RepID=A0ABR2LRH6_9ASPA
MALASSRRSGDLLPYLLRHLSTASLFPVSPHAFDPDIRRMAKSHRFSEIEDLLESRKINLPADASARELQLASSIVSYASSGMLHHALRTLDDLPRLGSTRTLLSLNALLFACNHSKTLFRRVPDLFSDLSRRHSLSPDKVSYGILIKSHCLARNASRALSILKEMDGKGIEITAVSYTTIIDSLYKENKPEEAERLWNEMRDNGVSPDPAAYNVRIMHRAKNGNPAEVLALMEEMKSAALEPDTFTYNYLMTCYCRHGYLDDAKRVYNELQEKGCQAECIYS